eukprot:1240870-Amphidinium_carterae.1
MQVRISPCCSSSSWNISAKAKVTSGTDTSRHKETTSHEKQTLSDKLARSLALALPHLLENFPGRDENHNFTAVALD